MGFKEFFRECQRVLKVTKKPNMKEYKEIVRVAGLGIAIIGLIGFFIHLLNTLIVG